jgi:hypothetical protein
MMFFPMAPSFYPPRLMGGGIPGLAPVIQATPGLSGNQLNALFSKSVSTFLDRFSGQLGENLAGALSGWLQAGFQGAW